MKYGKANALLNQLIAIIEFAASEYGFSVEVDLSNPRFITVRLIPAGKKADDLSTHERR